MPRGSLGALPAAKDCSRGGAEEGENSLHGDSFVSSALGLEGSHVSAAGATGGAMMPSSEKCGAVGSWGEAEDEGVFSEDVHVRGERIAREVYPAPRLPGQCSGKGLANQAPQVHARFLAGVVRG